MKILQVHNFYRIRGGECSVVDEEKKLLENAGHEVMRFSRNSTHIDDYGVLQKIKSFMNIPFNKAIYKDVISEFENNRPDVAHVHNVFPLISPSVYSALHDLNIPIVQTLHNYRFLCPNGQFFINGNICKACQTSGFISAVKNKCVRNNRVVSALYASAISRSWKSGVVPNYIDKFIALNKFVADQMLNNGVSEEKISICGNFIYPVDTDIRDKKPYVLYLGRLSPEKGISTLLRAIASMSSVVLKIAGSGPEENALKLEAKKLCGPQVEFVGHVSGDDKLKLVAEATCMVVPSEWYENFPISILESLSLGTPVIASRIGGLPDMIMNDETGYLFTAGDHLELSNCIRKILSNEPKLIEMSKNAMDYSKRACGPEQHLHQLIDIYQQARNKI